MPTLIVYRPLRLLCDIGNPNRLLDQRSNLPPILLRGSAAGFELALGLDGNVFTSAVSSIIASLTVQVRATAVPDSAIAMERTIYTGFNDSLTQAAWDARSAQHGVVPFSAAECNIAAGTYWLAAWYTTPAGDKIIALGGNFNVVENGAGIGSTPATIPAGYTTAQADARFVPLAPASGSFRIKTTANGTFWQLKDSVTGLWSTVWFANGVLQIGPGEA